MIPADFPRPPRSPRHWPTWLGIALGWFLAHWPWWLVRRAGPALGTLMRVAMIERRGIARRNLGLCFPELSGPQRDTMLKASFTSHGIAVFEFLRSWWGPLAPLDRNYTITGLERLHHMIG